jgi:hypothetical protein
MAHLHQKNFSLDKAARSDARNTYNGLLNLSLPCGCTSWLYRSTPPYGSIVRLQPSALGSKIPTYILWVKTLPKAMTFFYFLPGFNTNSRFFLISTFSSLERRKEKS